MNVLEYLYENDREEIYLHIKEFIAGSKSIEKKTLKLRNKLTEEKEEYFNGYRDGINDLLKYFEMDLEIHI